jgi:hypothetical protein
MVAVMSVDAIVQETARGVRQAADAMREQAELWEALADMVTPLDDIGSVASILQGLTARDARFATVTRDLVAGIKHAAK